MGSQTSKWPQTNLNSPVKLLYNWCENVFLNGGTHWTYDDGNII